MNIVCVMNIADTVYDRARSVFRARKHTHTHGLYGIHGLRATVVTSKRGNTVSVGERVSLTFSAGLTVNFSHVGNYARVIIRR